MTFSMWRFYHRIMGEVLPSTIVRKVLFAVHLKLLKGVGYGFWGEMCRSRVRLVEIGIFRLFLRKVGAHSLTCGCDVPIRS